MEITLRDVFGIIKKGLVFILIVSVISATCAFFVSKFFIKKTYVSEVKLYVETTNNQSGSSNNNYSDYNYAVSLVKTYIEMLQTNKFYSGVSENLQNRYSASQLAGMISFSPQNETEVFKATVRANSPTDAKDIADSVAVIAPQVMADIKSGSATLRIVDDATLPTKPASPNVLNITLVAFFLAFVIATAIIFVRQIFDVKISYTDEMTTICGVPVLSAIPDFDSGIINSGK